MKATVHTGSGAQWLVSALSNAAVKSARFTLPCRSRPRDWGGKNEKVQQVYGVSFLPILIVVSFWKQTNNTPPDRVSWCAITQWSFKLIRFTTGKTTRTFCLSNWWHPGLLIWYDHRWMSYMKCKSCVNIFQMRNIYNPANSGNN